MGQVGALLILTPQVTVTTWEPEIKTHIISDVGRDVGHMLKYLVIYESKMVHTYLWTIIHGIKGLIVIHKQKKC